jgi:ectoine hydroxylase-related dioxygenase (phytanoyl-CoA dioxygenase family)
MMPEDVVAQYRAMLVREAGFMTPHGPHLDSWFSQGRNAVNLWMAIGRVSPGNGLLFYPKRYGEGLRRVGEAGDPAQYVGRPGGVCLEPADTLVFHGDHLHATEVNITDETRFVLTTRISLGPPRYRHRGTGWVPYYDLRLLGTPLRRFASLRSRLTISAARQAIGAARRAIRFRPGTAAR